MNGFKIVPQIECYEDAPSFVEANPFCEDDFILISKSVYEHDFKAIIQAGKVFFRSKYGQGEPNSDMVNALIRDFLDSGCKRIIAVGGGSVMDMAKLLCVCESGFDCQYLFDHQDELKHNYPLILVPTTCGSGSEVSNISIVEMLNMKTKLGLAKDPLYADKAILIPSLLNSVPDFYLYTSAVDGLVHAIESYLSARSNVYTRLFQEKAIRLYINNFLQLQQGVDRAQLMESFMVASNMAGLSFANTGTGCVHGISYPLSGTYHVTHGLANSIFLAEVLKMYERLRPEEVLNDLKQLVADCLGCEVKDAFEKLDQLIRFIVEVPTLTSLGMKEEEIVTFSESVVLNQQRLMSNGYVNLNKEQIQEIYKTLF